MAGTSHALQFDWLTDICECQSFPTRQRWILSTMSRYGHELVNLLWRILGNEQDVCDAYQTTFLHLLNQGKRYNDCCTLPTGPVT